MSEPPEVSVIVVSHETRELTRQCLEAARAALKSVPGELWLVDNASTDGTAEAVRSSFPDVHLVANTDNVGYGTANNQAMRLARGRVFLLQNSDALLTAAALTQLRQVLGADPRVAVVGARLVGPDGRPRPSARRFPSPAGELLQRFRLYRLLPVPCRSRLLLGEHALPRHAKRPDWVTGACLLVRREAFEQTGGFDESIFLYGEELDWCARLRRSGWRIAYAADAEVVHVGRASSEPVLGRRRLDLSLEGDLRYLKRHRNRATVAAFGAVRALGLVFEAGLAALQGNRELRALATYQLRAHLRLMPRYTAGP